ncbi:MAG: DUF429 domain-containing protein [Chloroflexi bacterium]|nr:DUF429 domain-containing protein [Chloroflexota bacterium]
MADAAPPAVLAAGIDVSEVHGLDAAILGADGALIETSWLPGVAALGSWLDAWGARLTVVAVDAPDHVAREAGGRLVEKELRRRGVSLHLTPRSAQAAPGWMQRGWEVYEQLREHGFPVTRVPGVERGAVECFPYSTYVALTGAGRSEGVEPAVWARGILRRQGYVLAGTGKDAPDAVAAALTARAYLRGEAVAYGDPSEGVIWTPCALPERIARRGRRPGKAATTLGPVP